MRLDLTESFQRDARALSPDERAVLFETILALPGSIGQPHVHQGLGIRKLHPRGIWEARVGLRLRVLFGLEPHVVVLRRVGTHDEVRRYLREL